MVVLLHLAKLIHTQEIKLIKRYTHLHLHDPLLHLLPGNVPQLLVLDAQGTVEELLDLPKLEEGVAGMAKAHKPEE